MTRKWVREVRAMATRAPGTVARTITDLEQLRAPEAKPATLSGLPGRAPIPPVPQFVILSREAAKLSYLWCPAAIERPIYRSGAAGHRELCRPGCFAPIMDDEGIPLTRAELGTKKRRCRACGGPLWTADAAPAPLHARGRPVFPSALAVSRTGLRGLARASTRWLTISVAACRATSTC